MNIFHGSTIINRNRKKNLLKYQYSLNLELNELQLSKLRSQTYLAELPPDKTNKIDRIQWRIVLIQRQIDFIQNLILSINNFLQDNDGNFTNTSTLASDNSLSNNFIYNVHNYNKLTLPAFAPNYPVRLSYE